MRDGTITINVIPIPHTSGQGRGIIMLASAPARQGAVARSAGRVSQPRGLGAARVPQHKPWATGTKTTFSTMTFEPVTCRAARALGGLSVCSS